MPVFESLFNKALYPYLPLRVLSNTRLDNKTNPIQVTLRKRKKYANTEYDDKILENLMKYFEAETYEQLERFLKNSHIPIFK